MANNTQDTFGELRHQHFDGSDPFMTGGHQIIKTRRIKRVQPEWTKSDEEIKKVLLRSFPKLKTNARQRAGAARWTRFIHLYYRMGMTKGQVAAEMGTTTVNVANIRNRMRRVFNGQRANNTGKLSRDPGGTSVGSTPEKG